LKAVFLVDEDLLHWPSTSSKTIFYMVSLLCSKVSMLVACMCQVFLFFFLSDHLNYRMTSYAKKTMQPIIWEFFIYKKDCIKPFCWCKRFFLLL